MKKLKRILSIALLACMLVSALSVFGMAAESTYGVSWVATCQQQTNLRSGPGNEYSKVGTVFVGDQMRTSSAVGDTWYTGTIIAGACSGASGSAMGRYFNIY